MNIPLSTAVKIQHSLKWVAIASACLLLVLMSLILFKLTSISSQQGKVLRQQSELIAANKSNIDKLINNNEDVHRRLERYIRCLALLANANDGSLNADNLDNCASGSGIPPNAPGDNTPSGTSSGTTASAQPNPQPAPAPVSTSKGSTNNPPSPVTGVIEGVQSTLGGLLP